LHRTSANSLKLEGESDWSEGDTEAKQSIEFEYQRAATRGDGDTGEDVTENVRTTESVPSQLRGDYPGFLAVRGEVYMLKDAFQEYNKERVQENKIRLRTRGTRQRGHSGNSTRR